MKRKTVYSILTALMMAALVMTITGCKKNTTTETVSSEPVVIDINDGTSDVVSSEVATADPVGGESKTGRADGERFDGTIMLEGAEETVHYEHIVNNDLGFEMDYEYEQLNRKTLADREIFISVYDDENDPSNYLEVSQSDLPVDTVITNLKIELSQKADIETETRTLENAGEVTYIEASSKDGNMLNQMQSVYVIPAGNGTIVVRYHFSIEQAEGFAGRFRQMLDTLVLTK